MRNQPEQVSRKVIDQNDTAKTSVNTRPLTHLYGNRSASLAVRVSSSATSAWGMPRASAMSEILSDTLCTGTRISPGCSVNINSAVSSDKRPLSCRWSAAAFLYAAKVEHRIFFFRRHHSWPKLPEIDSLLRGLDNVALPCKRHNMRMTCHIALRRIRNLKSQP